MATGAYFGVNTESISYNVLSYIQSDGNQYIDTGFKPNQNTKIVMDLQPNLPVFDEENFDTWWCIPFGAFTRGNNDDYSSFDICIENARSEWAVNWSSDDPYGDTGTGYEVFSYTNNKRITISLEKTKVTLDGDTRNWTTANIQSDITLYLFAEHAFDAEYSLPSTTRYYTPMKLYSCQIYDNGTLVRDFVPCISSDNKVGLYDRVGRKFYSNVGSGTFTVGSLTGEEISSGGSTDNIARKIKNIYIGIDNKARKVKKAYIGIGGKARLWWSSEMKLSELPAGALVRLTEGGVATNFMIGDHNYESGLNGSGRTILVRHYCYDNRAWHSANQAAMSATQYAKCELDAWFNEEYKNKFSAEMQELMATTMFYYTVGGGDSTLSTLSRSVFALSMTELGWTYSKQFVEGSKLSAYVALRRCYYSGSFGECSFSGFWTRTPDPGHKMVKLSATSGNSMSGRTQWPYQLNSGDYIHLSRPAFTLPETLMVDPTPNADGSYNLLI